ncbi:MAG: TOBE domain-containing protein, partial [Pseudomonadota bacterium]
NMFVAGFIGSPKMNFLKASVAAVNGGTVTVRHPALDADLTLPTRHEPAVKPGDEVVLGLRPEHLAVGDGGAARLTLRGEFAESLGATSQLYAQTGSGETMILQVPGRRSLAAGEEIRAGFDPAHAYLFDSIGRAI